MNVSHALKASRLTVLPSHLEFLAPRAAYARRHLSSTKQSSQASATSAAPPRPKFVLNTEQRNYLDSAFRVNHAGELAACLIYTNQTPPVVRAHPHLRPLMKHMYDQEAGHFSTFEAALKKHRIRPTLMYPAWEAASSFLGWATGTLGREAAMACTEAVETAIGDHYNEQVLTISEWIKDAEDRGEEVDEEFKDYVQTLRRIRDEELEHLDISVEHDAKEANPYEAMTNIIRHGCKGAIWLSHRV